MGYYTGVTMALAFYDVLAGAPGMARFVTRFERTFGRANTANRDTAR